MTSDPIANAQNGDMRRSKYRPDIDGLRAVAVGVVIAFHLDEAVLSGGFIGVDVFFVISGYLITRIIHRDLTKETFSVLRFYERRVQRILPALFVMLLISFALGYRTLLPDDFKNLGKHLVASTLSVSNIISWLEFDYFRASGFVKPTLHTWSLAVEEQFYLGLPVILIFTHKQSRRNRVIVLGMLTAFSFIGSCYAVNHFPSGAYYHIGFRAWEFLAGSLLAFAPEAQKRAPRINEVTSVLGLGLILFPAVFYSSATPFPGPSAIPPCVGTLLLLRLGEANTSFLTRVLSTPIAVFHGQMSYSLYLWHWPVLVFFRYLYIRELELDALFAILMVTYAASWLSWRFVERPFRYASATPSSIWCFTTVVALVFVFFGATAYLSHGYPQRVPEKVAELASYRFDKLDYPEGLQKHSDKPKVLVWGDSHTNSLLPGVLPVLEKHEIPYAVRWSPGAPPVLGLNRSARHEGEAKEVLRFIETTESVQTIILIARWAFYLKGYSGDIGPAEEFPRGARFRTSDGAKVDSAAEAALIFQDRIKNTVSILLKAKKRVILVYPVPETEFDIPTTLAKLQWSRGTNEFYVPISNFKARQEDVIAALDSTSNDIRLTRVYPHTVLQTDRGFIVHADGIPIYHDSNHLTTQGAKLMMPLFDAALKDR